MVMTRPVGIVDQPPVNPGVCVKCGVQSGRDYFVDTGIDIALQYFNAGFEGVIYLCNECMESLITEYENELNKRVTPSKDNTYNYVNKGQGTFDLSGDDNESDGSVEGESGDSAESASGHDESTSGAESSTEPEPTDGDGDSSSAESVDSESDDAPGNSPFLFKR